MKVRKTNWKLKATLAGIVAAVVIGAMPRAYSAIDRTYEQLKILVDVLDYIKENYVETIDSKKLIYGAAGGMVKTLDPFSQFMEPDVHKEMKTETEGEFGGLGIRIGTRDGWLTVITPLPGTPAWKAGVLPGDRIVKIENESTKDLSLFDAVKRLRGAPGSKVTITVAREPESEKKDSQWTAFDVTMTREVIKIESVKGRMLSDGIGHLRINEFSGHTAEDVLGELGDLKKNGMQALVLDLRNNPGGLLSSAVDIASDFLGENKMVVYTQGRKSENRQEFRARSKGPYEELPMVVLINGGSASGSEIVAGALQDHRRAVIMGARSFGKASVQSVIPLSDGSGLRLTIAKYYTPSGRSIQRTDHSEEPKEDDKGGIIPDILITVPREVEAKLNAQIEEIQAPGKAPKPAVEKKDQVEDVVLNRAVELLKAREVLGRLRSTAAIPQPQ